MSSEGARIVPLRGSADGSEAHEIATGVPRLPGMIEKLTPFLRSSIIVVDREARIKDMLAPPNGLLGGLGEVGANVLEFCHPDDLAQALEFAMSVAETAPGWEGTWRTRLRRADGEWHSYDIAVFNCLDDPVIEGFVVRLDESSKVPSDEAVSNGFVDELELEPVASAVQIPIILFGAQRLAYFANNSARELCGEFLPLLEQQGLAAIASPTERDYVAEAVARRFAAPGETTITFHLDPLGTARRPPIIEAHFSSGVVNTSMPSSQHSTTSQSVTAQKLSSGCSPTSIR